jgi:biopolymer transport protein ExbD
MPFLRAGFLKAAHRPNYLYCRIDSIPYLGLAIVLLCIFMLNTSPNHGMSVDLVKSFHARPVRTATKEDAIRITVTRDGSVYFRHTKVVLDELPNRIHDATLNGAEKRIYLVVDARALYGNIKLIFPQIQLAGVENVCFLTN